MSDKPKPKPERCECCGMTPCANPPIQFGRVNPWRCPCVRCEKKREAVK